MAQYKTGRAIVTSGSAIVTGNSTSWQNNVVAGAEFKIQGENIAYIIASVSNVSEQITLTGNYVGTSGTKDYVIQTDFTENYNLPLIDFHDTDWPVFHSEAIRKIDEVTNGKEEESNKDTDYTLSLNSDIKYPSQKAIKTYVDSLIVQKAKIKWMYVRSIASYTALINDLPTIKNFGVNTIMDYRYPSSVAEPTSSDSGYIIYKSIVDAALLARLKVVVNIQAWTHIPVSSSGFCSSIGVPNYTGLEKIINLLKDHPAVCGWYADDESAGIDYTITTREAVYSFIKARVPSNHIVVETNYQYIPDAYSVNAHDLYLIDAYPYSVAPEYNYTDGGSDVAALAHFTDILTECKNNMPINSVMVVYQAFGNMRGTATHYIPPVGAQERMRAIVNSLGMDTVGMAWFIWNPVQTIHDTLNYLTTVQVEVANVIKKYENFVCFDEQDRLANSGISIYNPVFTSVDSSSIETNLITSSEADFYYYLGTGFDARFNKTPGDLSSGESTMFNFGQIGSVIDYNAFWNGFILQGHRVVENTTLRTWKGKWVQSVNYVIDDVVIVSSLVYRCIVAHLSSSGNIPPSTTYWTLVTENIKPSMNIYAESTSAYNPDDYTWYFRTDNTIKTSQSLHFKSFTSSSQTAENQGCVKFSTALADALVIARSGVATFASNVHATAFYGDGSNLTGIITGIITYSNSFLVSSVTKKINFASGLSASLSGDTVNVVIIAGTSAQYFRGDRSWQTLNQAAIAGLTTSDSPTFTDLSLSSGNNFLVGSLASTDTLKALRADQGKAISDRIPVLTTTYIPYSTGTVYTGTADFTWDASNKILTAQNISMSTATGTGRSAKITLTSSLDSYVNIAIGPDRSQTNQGVALQLIPKGTGLNANLKSTVSIFNTDFIADATNYEILTLKAAGSKLAISSDVAGAGTLRPIEIQMAGTPVLTITTTGDARVGADATNNVTINPTNGIVLNGTATVWKDVFFPMAPPKTTGAGNPTLVTWNTPLRGYSFAVNDVHDFDPQEFPHDGKQGAATGSWHIHWISRTNVAATRGVKWQVEYSIANINGVFPAPTTISVDVTVAANTADKTHLISTIGTFTTPNIGAQIYCRLTRITSAGTAPATDPVVVGVHFHYELDTLGSQDMINK